MSLPQQSVESSISSSFVQSSAEARTPSGVKHNYSESESTIAATSVVGDGSAHVNQHGWDKAVLTEVEPPNASQHDIEWQYLTFDTEVPPLASRPPMDLATPPNLRKYESPFLWNRTRKVIVTIICSIATGISAIAAGSYNSASGAMQKKWNVSPVVVELGITIFCVGFAIAPMLLAPFSEINGRRPLFVASGVGGSTFSSIVGGVISDIYVSEDRNTPMVFFAAGALFGTGLGPLYCGFIAQNASWRWVFYNQAILAGVAVAFMIAFFPETRGSVLLSQKAKVLNAYYEKLENEGFVGVRVPIDPSTPEKGTRFARLRYKTHGDEERQGLVKMITISVCRPFPICIGSIISTILSIAQDKLFVRYFPKKASTPEGRLYFACIGSLFLPIGLFWFGWTSYPSIPWIVPAMGVACATIGIFSIYVAVFNFLADAYHSYASSALAAQSCCRNMLGGVFPLVTRALFNNLGFPAASSLLGGIGCALTLVPWVLVLYGPQIRAKSKIASQTMAQPKDENQ
ncbi:hypothetical protein KEM56_006701 [Ascosphaera pollenicola]|nr:hypothetical protein KEM56_006701 [Ascosphaera pollenicola]